MLRLNLCALPPPLAGEGAADSSPAPRPLPDPSPRAPRAGGRKGPENGGGRDFGPADVYSGVRIFARTRNPGFRGVSSRGRLDSGFTAARCPGMTNKRDWPGLGCLENGGGRDLARPPRTRNGGGRDLARPHPKMAEAGTWPGLHEPENGGGRDLARPPRCCLLAVGKNAAISSPKPCWCPRGSDIAAGTRSRIRGRTAGR
jgi:hypothetical protein